jgi:hypothetical protein
MEGKQEFGPTKWVINVAEVNVAARRADQELADGATLDLDLSSAETIEKTLANHEKRRSR